MRKINEEMDKAWENFKEQITDICKDITTSKPDEILVPDNIHLCGGEQIIFNDDKQYLEWGVLSKAYIVSASPKAFIYKPHKLIPADPDNLETDCIYYHSNCELEDIATLSFYGIYDGAGHFIYINAMGFPNSSPIEEFNIIMKAVPVED